MFAAPLYLKTGCSFAQTHSLDITTYYAKKQAKQVALVKRMLDEYYPDAVQSSRGNI